MLLQLPLFISPSRNALLRISLTLLSNFLASSNKKMAGHICSINLDQMLLILVSDCKYQWRHSCCRLLCNSLYYFKSCMHNQHGF